MLAAVRSDGWSAARAVGTAKRGALRLRQREGAESFAAAQERVPTPPGEGALTSWQPGFRKVTLLTPMSWMETGFVSPVICRGRICAIRRKADDSAIFRLLRRIGEDTDRRPAQGLAR